MRAHVRAHLKGKLSHVFKNMTNGKRLPHPVLTQVMRALLNNDEITGRKKGLYFSRANILLSKWMSPSGKPSQSQTLFTHMGTNRDCAMRFVMTVDGPQYWRFDDVRLRHARKFGAIHYFTRDFANAFSRHLFATGGQVAPSMRLQQSEWVLAGVEVTLLANRQH